MAMSAVDKPPSSASSAPDLPPAATVIGDEPEQRFRLRHHSRQASAMGISAIVHMVALVTLGVIVMEPKAVIQVQEVLAQVLEEPDKKDELKIQLENQLTEVREQTTQVFSSSPIVGPVGASGPQGLISAPTMDRALLEQVVNANINVEGVFVDVPSSRKLIVEAPDGQVGEGRAVVNSYQDALDRITQEILWMLEKGPVLVVWAFDQSESMKDDQQEIRQRIEHVYTQLGLVNRANEQALETAIVSYGDLSNFKVHTKLPTYVTREIMSAIDSVPIDASGKEFMCSAVQEAITRHKQYAQRTRRQMALILVTDESGERTDNEAQLERAIADAKAARCRIYVLGREAVFGYPFVHIRWPHPQTKRVHWLPIDRGPETAFVEELQTDGFHRRFDAHPSGFGPYECTRLGRETGGIFFMLPSLETNLVRGEKRNYDIDAPYYPDLRSRPEVKSEIDKSPMRTMLEKVIYDLNPYNPEARKIIEMRVEFSKDYDTLAQQIRREQAKAVVYLQYLARAEETVGKMEKERRYEASPRWQANYDLLYAQLIAYQARMYEYGAYLEEFLQDVQAYVRNPADPKNKFKQPPATKSPNLFHIEWDLRTRQRTITCDKVKSHIERATAMFKQIMANHPGTPWAARAEYELKRGFGVELIPDYDIFHPEITNPIPIPKM
jgi:von Willebrand factor type A domain